MSTANDNNNNNNNTNNNDYEWEEVKPTWLRQQIRDTRVFFTNAYNGMADTRKNAVSAIESVGQSTQKQIESLSQSASGQLTGTLQEVESLTSLTKSTETLQYSTVGRVVTLVAGTAVTSLIFSRFLKVKTGTNFVVTGLVGTSLMGKMFPEESKAFKRFLGRNLAQPHVKVEKNVGEVGLKGVAMAMDSEIAANKNVSK